MTVEVICPYCNCAIEEAQDSVHPCAACGTRHHAECWQENNGCTVYGCTAAPPDEPKLTVQATDFAPRPVQPTPMFLGQPVPLGVSPGYAPPPPPQRPVPPPPPVSTAFAPPPPLQWPVPPPPVSTAYAPAPAQYAPPSPQYVLPAPPASTAFASASPPYPPPYAPSPSSTGYAPAPRQYAPQMTFGGYAVPTPAVPPSMPFRPAVQIRSRSRRSFVLRGVFLGAFGVHNFYAGYKGRGRAQLAITLCTLFFGSIISWIWAIVEVCIVDRDARGILMT